VRAGSCVGRTARLSKPCNKRRGPDVTVKPMALSRRFLKRSVVTVIALGVLVLNPVFGVLSRPDFGAAEMRAASWTRG
jgi:hypothetical protein